MKMIAPNIARPTTNPSALAIRNTAERKRLSGMIGSAARRSCQTNAARNATLTTPRPMIVGEPQAWWCRPRWSAA